MGWQHWPAANALLRKRARDLRQAVDEVMLDVMEGQAPPQLLAEPIASIKADLARLQALNE